MRFVVGSAAGGTYDLLARAVARHLGAHIPGNPFIIVQNQPTAGGMVMTNQLYALGPKDGTAIGVPINGIPAAPLLQPSAAHYDAAKLIWVGSTNREPYVAYVWHTAPVQSLAELLTKTTRRGRHDARHDHGRLPAAHQRDPRHQIQDRARLWPTPQMNMAMERGETEGVGALGWEAVKARMTPWIKDKKIKMIAQFGFERASVLPDVPLIYGSGQDRGRPAGAVACCSRGPKSAGPIFCRPTCRRIASRPCGGRSTRR